KVELNDLFFYGRIKYPITFKHLLFALYLPFALLLWPIRLMYNVILFTFLLFMPHWMRPITKPLLAFGLGIITNIKDKHNLPGKHNPNSGRIIVSNHLTDYDPHTMYTVLEDYHVVVKDLFASVPLVGKVYRKMGAIFVDYSNRDTARQQITGALSKTEHPVIIYPEGGLTNGKSGMLMFQKFVFSLGLGITPISMRYTSQWPIHVDYIGSTFLKNTFWWLIVPYHTYEMKVFPTEYIREGETDVEFAKRVQTMIANDLGLEPTDIPMFKKRELFNQIVAARSAKKD
ncbi:hypothetical protein SAMD00019534_057070, partial [Acytostelium subglobosum LB1]|uniref:hypothetical protein n=1 Tax=Acytostelium subglobosum LB1 TaxID=1410327 RepID=UPI0006447E7F